MTGRFHVLSSMISSKAPGHAGIFREKDCLGLLSVPTVLKPMLERVSFPETGTMLGFKAEP